MFNLFVKSLTFALAMAAGLALSTAYAIEANAATYSGNDRVFTHERNPVCRMADTVYRVRVVNNTNRKRNFLVSTSGAKRVLTSDGWDLEPHTAAVVRLRVQDGERLRFSVQHRGEVLHYGTRVNVCGPRVWYPLPDGP